ncbi:MAG: M14 family zinc carboxypeptidase [Candidatus Aminicenantales bacterium]
MKRLVSRTAALLILSLLALPAAAGSQTATQSVDKDYTAKILEYTTEKFFLTEFVDHLPVSETVPSPSEILGHIVGAPDILDHSADIYMYMRALASASPRVQVFSIGPTDEGREMIAVAVSSEENMARLERLKEIMARLADPRGLKDEEAAGLRAEGLPVYWITGGLHSQECGSPEMMMELAYRLAVGETDFLQVIRKNMVVLITPILEVDGWDKAVDVYLYKKENKDKKTIPLVYWGKYAVHDNNRDSIGLGLKLSENLIRAYFDWHPIVMHDLHESIPYLYTSTGTGPFNAWLDPITINEWEELAFHEVSELTRRGVPGVWTHGFFDGWGASYAFSVAHFHNSTGRFYETYGGTGADTMVRTVGAEANRAWFRPNPPLKTVKWSFRNNINLQQSGLLVTLNHIARNKDRFLENFYLKSQRSAAKARTEGPAAYIVPGDTKRPLAAGRLVNLLRKNGVEVHVAKAEITLGKDKYLAGSYVVRMDQPYSRCADMLLDTQYYNPKDPRPYDDTGWTLGPLHNVKTVRISDTKILDASMVLLDQDVRIEGKVAGKGKAAGFAVNHTAEPELMTFRYRLKDVKMLAAEDGFSQGKVKFVSGSFIIPGEGNPADLEARLEAAAKDLGLMVHRLPALPDIKTHELDAPRLAILHSWLNTQDEGWFRLALDKFEIPYSYIPLQEIRDNEDLRSKYDVIIFPPAGMMGKSQRTVNGIGGENPIPWMKSEKYPHLGVPDSREDIRGGIELQGIAHLRRFIEEGGLFIPITSMADLPISYGIVESVAVIRPQKLKAGGSVLSANITDLLSPIGYGYDRNLGVYFGGGPVFETGFKAVIGMEIEELLAGGPEAGRPSGRGSLKDPDVIQGRPRKAAAAQAAGGGIPTEYKELFDLYMPPDLKTVRVIMRFDAAAKLLVSGMLDGGEELANKPAIVDVPVGKGHVLFFSFNPVWRHQTPGSYFLLFNAALNYRNLDAGQPEPAAEKKEAAEK